MNNIEKMFYDEVRDKKRTARGSFHNSGRRGGGTKGVSSVKTPSDVLKYSDKQAYKEYIKPGGITMSNVYDNIDNIPTVSEIKDKDFAAGQVIVKAAKSSHKMKDLSKHWGLSGYSLYKLFDDFEIKYPKHPRTKSVPEKKQTIIQKQESLFREAYQHKEDQQLAISPPIDIQKETDSGELQIKYNRKEVVGAETQERINDLMKIIYPDRRYEVKLFIMELPEK